MKALFDLLPVLLFFGAYKLYDIYVATGVAIAATAVQIGFFWLKNRRVEKSQIITLVILVVLGGATILLQNEAFIKWKPTVVNWLFSAVFIGSQFVGKKTIAERMMGQEGMQLSAKIWQKLNMSWALFFLFLGGLNLFVAFTYDTDTWVNFKLFGLTGMTLAFIFGQVVFLSRHMQPQQIEQHIANDKENTS